MKKRKRLPNGRNAGGQFIKLDHGLLDSEAWRHLSPPAERLLLAIWRRHDGSNNGRIPYSVAEAVALLRCRKASACAAFTELEDKGLLRCRRDSSFTMKLKAAREWAVTAESEDGQQPTRDFRSWKAVPKI